MTRSCIRLRVPGPAAPTVSPAPATTSPAPARTTGAGVGQRRSPLRYLRLAGTGVIVLVATSGCEGAFGWPSPITPQGKRMYDLWVGSCIAALAVSGFIWALIGFTVVRFRKRSEELPRQVRYNLPIEVLYTVVPVIIVGALFYYTARDETYIDKISAHPDVTVDVMGFQWNWEFGYENTGTYANLGAVPHAVGAPGQATTLVLPAHRSILFKETSRDVIHSFWVPKFLFKRDVIPGRVNQFEITSIDQTGTFIGRCAELCGVNHDQMNFYVKVIPPEEFDRWVATQTTAAGAAGGTALTPTSSP